MLNELAFLGVCFPDPPSRLRSPCYRSSNRPTLKRTSILKRADATPLYNASTKTTHISHPRCSALDWSSISSDTFSERLQSNSLHLCLVGMSNCGKSYWARLLHQRKQFRLIGVDDCIEERLRPELATLGYFGIDGMAKWMGLPSDPHFSANQTQYLAHEERITSTAAPKSDENTVLDTTGSVIYLTADTLVRLRSNYLIVHLEASDNLMDTMITNFFQNPKPVVWGNAFSVQAKETPEDAMRRCYPILLGERRKMYNKLAHVRIPAAVSICPDTQVDDFLAEVRQQLH